MADTLNMDKSALVERAKELMQKHLSSPNWTIREKVALSCRILFDNGHDSGLAGQITARTDHDGLFYTQRLGLGFDEITAANLLIVDEDLGVVQGDGMPNPANRFHTWIYHARPEVKCVVHTHPPYLCALGMLGRPLKVAQMDACMLYDDVAYLPSWPGIPVGNSEGEIISAALGKKRAILLAHHGVVVAAQSVEEACVVAIQCERAARLQLLAESAGDMIDLPAELAREAHDWILQEKKINATFYYFSRRIINRTSQPL